MTCPIPLALCLVSAGAIADSGQKLEVPFALESPQVVGEGDDVWVIQAHPYRSEDAGRTWKPLEAPEDARSALRIGVSKGNAVMLFSQPRSQVMQRSSDH